MLLGAMGADDQDGSWEIDCTTNMTARGDTIASIGATIVIPATGEPVGAGDPTIANETVTAAGLKFTFDAHTNGDVGDYLLGFPLTLTSGDRITRWAILPVIPKPG